MRPATRLNYPAGPRDAHNHDGRVYTIGAMGQMFCFDAKTGKVLWSKDFVKDFNTKLPIWGMATSPLVDGDQLITLVGGENALVVSFDKVTGAERWRALDDPEVGYSPRSFSPSMASGTWSSGTRTRSRGSIRATASSAGMFPIR